MIASRVARSDNSIFALSVLFVFLAAVVDPADRSHVPTVGGVRRLAARAGYQHPHTEWLRGVDWLGGEKRHIDCRVRRVQSAEPAADQSGGHGGC